MTQTFDEAPEPRVFTLTPAEYRASVAKFAKVNERAVKRGFTGRLTVEGTRREITTKDDFGFERTEVVYDVEVGGTAPSYNGWTFLARVDALEGGSFTLATAPGVDHVDRSLVRSGACDHCGAARFRRNTYLVRSDETGEVKNVGSTCIKDFLGWDASLVFFSTDDAAGEFDEYLTGGGAREWTYTVEYVLAVAYAATKAFGWVPATSFDDVPTKARVFDVINPPSRMTDQQRAELETVRRYAAEANERAAVIRDFILSDDFNGSSTYVDNLKAAVAVHEIGSKQVGLVASAPRAYTRHLETEADRKAQQARWDAEKQAKAASGFVGQVGDKNLGIKASVVEVEGTVEAVRFISGDYGTTTLYTILGKDGNLYKWFSSAGSLGDDTGVEVHIKGTVKKHEEYNGVKSTVLTRCKAV